MNHARDCATAKLIKFIQYRTKDIVSCDSIAQTVP